MIRQASVRFALVTAALSLAVGMIFAALPAIAQQAANIPELQQIVNMYREFGKVKAIVQTSKATAVRETQKTKSTFRAPLKEPQTRAPAQPTLQTVQFQIPADQIGQLRIGQRVWVNLDATKVAFVEFPIKVATFEETVGRGVGQGRFKMRTRDLVVSNNGRIAGFTRVKSEDKLEGFTGSVFVRVFDFYGNELVDPVLGGTFGVNMDDKYEEEWHKTIPEAQALQIRKVEVFHLHTPKARLDALLRDIKKILDVAEKGVEVYGKFREAGAQGGGGTGSGPTEPTAPATSR